METENTYKNFNENKSIEELQYNMFQNKMRLEVLKTDNQFYKYLLKASIYKPHSINLFEKLQHYKNNINKIEKKTLNLLEEVNSQINHISNKIECEDLVYDTFFITNYELLERKIQLFFIKSNNDKLQMFEYLHSVIMT